jgi:hypothetical protein
MTTRARILTGAIALAAALAFAGCGGAPGSTVTRLPSDVATTAPASASPSPSVTTADAPSPSATPVAPADGTIDCADGEQALAGSSQTFVLAGECPAVRIEGNAVTVDATTAVVGSVTVSGDRIRLDAQAVGDVTVQGNDVTVNAASTQALTVRGDRNTVTAPGGSTRVLLSGNDNVIAAPTSDVVDDGQRNTVR